MPDFSITTPDPLFDPTRPVTINGYEYVPSGVVRSAVLDEAFAKGAGDNAQIAADPETWNKPGKVVGPTGQKQLNDLAYVARQFIDTNKVGCAENTVEDRVYENAPGLIEKLAEIVGYYRYPEEN